MPVHEILDSLKLAQHDNGKNGAASAQTQQKNNENKKAKDVRMNDFQTVNEGQLALNL